MELIIQILMLFIVINCLLKLSFWKLWQTIIFGLVCSGFILYTCQYAITQSKTQLYDYLQNTKIMQDMAVFVTVESVLCLAFCFVSLKSINGEKNNKWFKVLNWYPGLLIFPVLFYILTQTIYAMPGTNFSIISYILAGVVFIAFPALSYFFRYLLPEKELRLEVYFLVSLFVCLIGLITTVNDTVVYARNETPLNIKALIISGGIFVVMFFIGYLWNKIKWIIFRKRKN